MDSRMEQFVTIIESDLWLMDLLRLVGDIEPQRCYIGAGAVRDVVWDRMSGIEVHDGIKDIDVVYFDARSTGGDLDAELEQGLAQQRADVQWDVKNQAGVHLWFKDVFGYDVAPFASLGEAVASWPEYASAVSVRLEDKKLDVIAPYGLEDLLEMRVRRNPVRVTEDEYRRRTNRKKYTERWPEVTIQ